ncbi:hypothetical protein GG344DRAFT_67631 [Lentinula edodes]|nr:hypothetical protein GG344DRAFT_67631 [Lentinula edodes]
MARRSARIQAQTRANTSSELQDSNAAQPLLAFQDEEQNIEEQEDHIEDERPRKRARNYPEGPRKKKRRGVSKLSRKVRGRLGLLERLSKDIPLDVILEIFCYLEPRDLLRLARTSLDLRHILMSRTSESIWRAARENVEGLPPCPADLNEPQYAHILFEPFCHVCSRRVESVLWTFRVRYCKDCASGLPSCNAEFYAEQPEGFRAILPRELICTCMYFSHFLFAIAILSVSAILASQEWKFVCDSKIADRLRTEFEALQSANERTAWIAQKTQESDRMSEASVVTFLQINQLRLCQDWFAQKERERAHEQDKIRRQRKEDILMRLDEIGWRQEAEAMMKTSDYSLDPFSQHKLVKQPRKLTDYGWNTIKDKLVEMLSDHKKTGLATV